MAAIPEITFLGKVEKGCSPNFSRQSSDEAGKTFCYWWSKPKLSPKSIGQLALKGPNLFWEIRWILFESFSLLLLLINLSNVLNYSLSLD